MTLQVELVSPEEILFSGEADMVVCRTTGGGEIAFMTGHVPFIATLAGGEVKIYQNDRLSDLLAVHSGFVEVDGRKVAILSDVAEVAGSIDVARAERARERAEEALRGAPDDADAAAALRRAQVRLRVADAASTVGA